MPTILHPSSSPFERPNVEHPLQLGGIRMGRFVAPGAGLHRRGPRAEGSRVPRGPKLSSVILATEGSLAELGLDPRYAGWNLNTKFNSGDARITGGEFNVRQSLRRLGKWGSYFTVFANATNALALGVKGTF